METEDPPVFASVCIIDVSAHGPMQWCHTLPDSPTLKAIRELLESVERSALGTGQMQNRMDSLHQRLLGGRNDR